LSEVECHIGFTSAEDLPCILDLMATRLRVERRRAARAAFAERRLGVSLGPVRYDGPRARFVMPVAGKPD
jgi:hypothetical protein